MRQPRAYLILSMLCTILLLISCGQRYEAKGVVKAFVEANATDAKQLEITSFGKLDSTRVISDSIIHELRNRKDPMFKSGITYPEYHKGEKLLFIRMRYRQDGEEHSKTFYLDEHLTGVVAYK